METTTETVIIQVRQPNGWNDYSRCTPQQAEAFLLARRYSAPDEWRAVDWITKKPLSSVDLDERVDRVYFDCTHKDAHDHDPRDCRDCATRYGVVYGGS